MSFKMKLFTTMLHIFALTCPCWGDEWTVAIVAHRGASSDAPENTVAAIKLAWEQKADASEFDIYMTKDGKIVVIHDADTTRTAGMSLQVAKSTLAELRLLDVGKWKGEKFADEKIPILEEMLETVPRGKKVFIEVKCGPEIIPELDRVLKAAKLNGEQTPIISFNAAVVTEIKKARPDLPAYWIVGLNKKEKPFADGLIEKAKAMKADGLDLSASPLVDADYVKAAKAAGLKLYVWTVNDVTTAKRMVEIGVDGITTDKPGWLREQLGK